MNVYIYALEYLKITYALLKYDEKMTNYLSYVRSMH